MGIFLRQLWKQKPQAYGPVSAVQRDIFLNAERRGIDPSTMTMCLPLWGPGVQINYINGTKATSQVNFSFDGRAYFSTGYLYFPDGFPIGDAFTCIATSQELDGSDKYLLGWGGATNNGGPHYGRRNSISVRFGVWGDGTVDCAEPGPGSYTWEERPVTTAITKQSPGSGTGSVYHHGRFIASGTLNTSALTSSAGYIGALPNGNDPWSGYIDFITLFTGVKTDCQIALLSDNPYILLQRNPQRTFFVPEAGGGTTHQAVCADGFTFSDASLRTAIFSAFCTESINLSDNDSNIAQFLASLSDSFGVSSTVAARADLQGVSADGVSVSDVPGTTAIYPVLVQDSFTADDSVTALQKIIALVADDVSISDASIVRADLQGVASDAVSLSDTLTATLQAQAVVSEIINLSDSVTGDLSGALAAFVTDGLSLSDSATARTDFVALVTDAFDLSDAATAILQARVAVTDSFTVSDSTFWAAIQQALVEDSFTVSGSVTGLIRLIATAADSIALTDANTVTATFSVQCNDTVQFAQTIAAIAQLRASVSDGFNVTATAMEVSTLPNGKVSVSFSLKTPGTDFDMKTTTIVFNLK